MTLLTDICCYFVFLSLTSKDTLFFSQSEIISFRPLLFEPERQAVQEIIHRNPLIRKAEFLAELERKLEGLPAEDLQRAKDYYTEMIDDRVEEGMSEKDAEEAAGDQG